jgi:hypothetical protein
MDIVNNRGRRLGQRRMVFEGNQENKDEEV